MKLFKQTVENCYGYGKVGVALLDIQSYNQLCGKLETLFIKRLLSEDCLRCADLCVSRNQRTFVWFQTAISFLCPQKAQGALHDQKCVDNFHWVLIYKLSAVSYFSSCSSFRHTEHIKEALQIFYTSPRRSRYACGLHILLYNGFMKKIVYYIQYHQKGTTAKKKKIQYFCTL